MGFFCKAKQEQPQPAPEIKTVEEKNNKPLPSVEPKHCVPTQKELEIVRKRQELEDYHRRQAAKLSMTTDFCVAMLQRKDYCKGMVDDALKLAEELMKKTVECKPFDLYEPKKPVKSYKNKE